MRSKLSPESVAEVLADRTSCYYEFVAHVGGSCLTDVCLDCAKKLAPVKEFLHDPDGGPAEDCEGPYFVGCDEILWERRFHCYLCNARIPTIRRDASWREKLRSFWEYQRVEIELFPLIWKEDGFLAAMCDLLWIPRPKKNDRDKEDPDHIGEIL